MINMFTFWNYEPLRNIYLEATCSSYSFRKYKGSDVHLAWNIMMFDLISILELIKSY